jgi:hypothetical protein
MVAFGGPSHEIIIDGVWYELSFFKPGGFGTFRSNIETGVCCEPLCPRGGEIQDEDLQFLRMIEDGVLLLMISPTLMVQEIRQVCHHLDQGSKVQSPLE